MPATNPTTPPPSDIEIPGDDTRAAATSSKFGPRYAEAAAKTRAQLSHNAQTYQSIKDGIAIELLHKDVHPDIIEGDGVMIDAGYDQNTGKHTFRLSFSETLLNEQPHIKNVVSDMLENLTEGKHKTAKVLTSHNGFSIEALNLRDLNDAVNTLLTGLNNPETAASYAGLASSQARHSR